MNLNDPTELRQTIAERSNRREVLERRMEALGRKVALLEGAGDRVGAELVRAQIAALRGAWPADAAGEARRRRERAALKRQLDDVTPTPNRDADHSIAARRRLLAGLRSAT